LAINFFLKLSGDQLMCHKLNGHVHTVVAEGRERTSNGNSSSFIFNRGKKATS